MPIGGTPIIVHLMSIYAGQGITDFVLAAGHRQEALRDYFHGRFHDWSIDVVVRDPERRTTIIPQRGVGVDMQIIRVAAQSLDGRRISADVVGIERLIQWIGLARAPQPNVEEPVINEEKVEE